MRVLSGLPTSAPAQWLSLMQSFALFSNMMSIIMHFLEGLCSSLMDCSCERMGWWRHRNRVAGRRVAGIHKP